MAPILIKLLCLFFFFSLGRNPESELKKRQSNQLRNSAPMVQSSTDLSAVFNDSIYMDLSWSVKVLILRKFLNTTPDNVSVRPVSVKTVSNSPEKTEISKVTESPVVPERPKLPDCPELRERSEQTRHGVAIRKRVPEIESLVIRRRQEGDEDRTEDDNTMRLQLFRLMYETIQDSDLKRKRAELIRSYYNDSSSFEIGYLMGDVMGKFSSMSVICMTLARIRNDWKPIEYLTAYEQISSQAVEINHLIDTIKSTIQNNQPNSNAKSRKHLND